jgi:hypothetical protein
MVYEGYHSRGQNKRHRTHLKHNKHVEAIKKCREYLAEVRFSQWDSNRQVTSYRDQLSEKYISCQYSQTSVLKQSRIRTHM